jgi:transcriptional regulator with XRE-family HTH domain
MPKTYTYYFDHNAVQEARIDAGLSIADVADRSGLEPAGIRGIENPNRLTAINHRILETFAELYGVRPRSLMKTKHGRHNAGHPRADAPGRKVKIRR